MRNRKIIIIVSIILVVLFALGIVMNSISDLKSLNKAKPQAVTEPEATQPQFIKEGMLTFISSVTGDTLSSIDIEIADDDLQRQQGLMYRSSMNENQGMLFIFDRSEQQNFWMKNTIISLDIIYVDDTFKIVTIHKNTQPYSENQIPSYKNAKYVIEVNAGYCNRHNINEGDLIYSKAFMPSKVQV